MISATTSTPSLRIQTRATPGVCEALPAANERPAGMACPASRWAWGGERDAGASCDETATVASASSGRQHAPLDAGDRLERCVGQRPRVVAMGGDGTPYPGDLLADILDYRALRSHHLCGMALDRRTALRLGELEDRLRSRPDARRTAGPELRAYHRHACRFAASILMPAPHAVVHRTEVQDLSAGGVKISPAPAIEPGDAVWLEIAGGEGTVMLPARVAWTRDGSAGLMFAGAPRWR